MTTTNDVTTTIAKQPKWDGRPSTFGTTTEEISRYLIRQKVAHTIPALNMAGFPAPNGAGANTQMARDRAQAYVFLADTVSMSDFRSLVTQHDDAVDTGDIAPPVDGWPENDTGHVDMDPVRLWTAFQRYARGPIADLSGPALHDRVQAWKWPGSAGDGSTVQQVKQAIQELREFHQQGSLINDRDYPLTEAMMCRRFKAQMPQRFQLEYTSYETIGRLHALSTRALTDADRFDRTTHLNNIHMTAATMSPGPSGGGPTVTPDATMELLLSKIEAMERQLKSRRDAKPTTRMAREERMNHAIQPKTARGEPEYIWCDHHGWGRHNNSKCLHVKNDNFAGRTVGHSNIVRCIENADGTFSKVHTTNGLFDSLNSLAAAGVIDPNDGIYIDSCADLSLSNTLVGMTNIRQLDPKQAPVLDGTNHGPPIRATHAVTRELNFEHVDQVYHEECFYGPDVKYNLSSTNTLAGIGLSTLHDAESHDNRLTLVPAHTSNTILCNRVGNVWQLPLRIPKQADVMNPRSDTLTLPTLAGSPGPRPVDVPNMPSDCDPNINQSRPTRNVNYRWFRESIGNPSHDRTAKTAGILNIKLTDLQQARVKLDEQMHISNQSARPLVHVDGDDLEPTPYMIIVGDTCGGGSSFPESAAGNTNVQTWVLKSAPGDIFVTVGPNHTAQNSVDGFRQFCQDAGLVISQNMINSGFVFASDNGGEYAGKFKQMCDQAGIKIVTCTPNKKSGLTGLAEGANKAAQQRMRAIMGTDTAKRSFERFNIDMELYWDHAVVHAAKQERSTRTVLHGTNISYEQFTRTLACPWGSFGVVTLQPKDVLRKFHQKQLAERGVLGIMLGLKDHKYIMLLADKRIMLTSDVSFDPKQIALLSDSTTPDQLSHTVDLDLIADIDYAHDLEANHLVVSAVDTAPEASFNEASFYDIHGHPAHVDDRIRVYWPAEEQFYTGTITNIDPSNGLYSVNYDDEIDIIYRHHLNQVDPMQVEVNPIAVAHATRTWTPHPSVAEYITTTGDIREPILTGIEQLPACPRIPSFQPSTAPSMPITVRAALASPEAIYWLHSIVNEYSGHTNPSGRPPTFHPTLKRNPGRQLQSKWTFKIKWNDDKVVKFKSRMCIAGWGLNQGIDYFESYSGSAPVGELYLLESYAVLLGLHTNEIDLVQAYCIAKMPETPSHQPVIISAVPGTKTYTTVNDSPAELSLHVDQSLYGFPSAGFSLARLIHDRLLNRHLETEQRPCPLNLNQSEAQPVLFSANTTDTEFDGELFYIWIQTDNIRCYYSNQAMYDLFHGWCDHEFPITGDLRPLSAQPPTTCIGISMEYGPDSVTMSMPAFVKQALHTAGMSDANPASSPIPAGFQLDKSMGPDTPEDRAVIIDGVNTIFGRAIINQFGAPLSDWDSVTRYYTQHVSTIGWISKQVAPILALPHSLLGRAMSNPPLKAFKALKQVYRFLVGKPNIGMTLRRDRLYDWRHGDLPAYTMQSDSSFADDASDRKSQGGYLGRVGNLPPCHVSTKKSSRVLDSTNFAETYHSARGCRQAVYITQLLDFLGLSTGPIHLELDNQATVSVVGAPIRKFSHRSKHFEIDDRYTVQCVEDGTVTVSHVPGSLPANFIRTDVGFPVDALTKALPTPILSHYLLPLHGTVGGEVEKMTAAS